MERMICLKKKIAVALGLILILAVVVGAFVKGNKDSVAEVETAEAKTMEYEDKVLATGSVELVDVAELSTTMLAEVTLHVQEGEQVSKGQLLAELDLVELEQQKKDAEAGLKAAETNLSKARQADQDATRAISTAEKELAVAKAHLEEIAASLKEGKGSPEQLEEAQQKFAGAQQALQAALGRKEAMQMQDPELLKMQVDQAKSAVETINSSLEKGKLTAPFDGVVYQVATKNHSYAQPGMPLITVGNPDTLEVVANLSEQDISGVEKSQQVDIRWPGSPDELVKGEVTRIAPSVSTPSMGMGETETHIKVYIALEQGEVNLKPGATVDVVIYRVQPRQALLIPNEALFEDDGAQTVFVVADGIAKKCIVKTGYSNELYTEILQGIEEKSRVILDPEEIRDGQKVRATGGVAL